ncbi:MAG: hypothetical protein A3J38_02260 [Gammaproteobacteria bacterium RIFCSPHIGHO2_12_FULL_45_9]|nr:MAG: hypothetical protein A3J38_02260 [Gammaproteobacteria bacterium RIFCSPHIGHO2_12_FULL_45_9]
MVEINFLPWRELEHAHYRRQTFFLTVLAMGLVSAALLLLHFMLLQKISKIQGRIAVLQQEKINVNTGNGNDKKLQLAIVQNGIEKVKYYQWELIKVLTELRAIPMHSLCMTRLELTKNALKMTGYARSFVDLTQVLTYWETTPVFAQLRLSGVEKYANTSYHYFYFHGLVQQYPVWNQRYELDKDIIEE